MTAEVLLTWLAQSTALASAAGVAVCLPGCRSNAAARSAVWSVTIALSAAVLAWHVLEPSLAPAAAGFVPSASAARGSAPVVLPASSGVVATWLAWLWMAGSALAFAVIGLDIVRVLRLKHHAKPLTARERSRLGRLADEVSACRGTRVCWSDGLDSPAALGFGRPVVALPSAQANRLSDEQLAHVVLHELAHVRRRDDWRTLAEQVLTAAAWINPAVQFASRRAALAREMACDEWVVRRTASPAAYARCLADVAALRTSGRLGLVAAVTGSPGMLRRRVAAVLACDCRRHAGALGMVAWAAPLGLCLAGIALLQVPQMFVVAQRPAAARIADARPAADAESSAPFAAVMPAAAGVPRPIAAGRKAAIGSHADVAPARMAALTASVAGADLPRVPVLQAEALPLAERQPLPAVPVAPAGAAGIGAAAGQSGTLPISQAPGGAWWRGPGELGDKTGLAAVTAGRATASFLKRVGSSVPKVFAH